MFISIRVFCVGFHICSKLCLVLIYQQAHMVVCLPVPELHQDAPDHHIIVKRCAQNQYPDEATGLCYDCGNLCEGKARRVSPHPLCDVPCAPDARKAGIQGHGSSNEKMQIPETPSDKRKKDTPQRRDRFQNDKDSKKRKIGNSRSNRKRPQNEPKTSERKATPESKRGKFKKNPRIKDKSSREDKFGSELDSIDPASLRPALLDGTEGDVYTSPSRHFLTITPASVHSVRMSHASRNPVFPTIIVLSVTVCLALILMLTIVVSMFAFIRRHKRRTNTELKKISMELDRVYQLNPSLRESQILRGDGKKGNSDQHTSLSLVCEDINEPLEPDQHMKSQAGGTPLCTTLPGQGEETQESARVPDGLGTNETHGKASATVLSDKPGVPDACTTSRDVVPASGIPGLSDGEAEPLCGAPTEVDDVITSNYFEETGDRYQRRGVGSRTSETESMLGRCRHQDTD